jgi:hypothetical protein
VVQAVGEEARPVVRWLLLHFAGVVGKDGLITELALSPSAVFHLCSCFLAVAEAAVVAVKTVGEVTADGLTSAILAVAEAAVACGWPLGLRRD